MASLRCSLAIHRTTIDVWMPLQNGVMDWSDVISYTRRSWLTRSAPKDPGFAVKFLINRFIKEGVSNSDSDDVWAVRVGIEHAWTNADIEYFHHLIVSVPFRVQMRSLSPLRISESRWTPKMTFAGSIRRAFPRPYFGRKYRSRHRRLSTR